MKVKFLEVGRDKRTFEAKIASLSHENLERALRRAAAIRSRDVTFVRDDDSLARGWVVVGAGRVVGRWEVAP